MALRDTSEVLALRAAHARLAGGPHARAVWPAAPFGDARVDLRLPGGGLARGRWHEIAGAGAEQEIPAAASGFAARLARLCAGRGAIVWVLARDDLYAPGLAAHGLDPARVIYVRAKNDAQILSALEDALRTRGVGAAVGEAGCLDLVAGKRLQLASARHGASGFVLRRRLYGGPRGGTEISAATTRWCVAPAPSQTDEPGLGPARWRVRLERAHGGREGAWMMEADDDAGALRVVAELADHAVDAAGGASRRARAGDDGAPGRRAASDRG